MNLRWTHGAFFLLGAALVIALRSLPLHAPGRHPSALAPTGAMPVRPPWGQLEYTEIDLPRPVAPVPDEFPPPPPLEWHFEGFTKRQVTAVFEDTDLTAGQREFFGDTSRWRNTGTHWVIEPTLEVVRNLSSAARQRIYAVLRQSERNPYQTHPFRFAPEKFAGWLVSSGLSPENQDLVRRLSYIDGPFVCFADMALLERACTREELVRFDQAVAQTPALLVKVRVSSPEEIKPLLSYWNAQGRSRAVEPLLKSLSRLPGGFAISVSALFPPMPRKRLYTYPDPQADSSRQDCFWTAMNFFNDPPDNRFFDWDFTREELRTQYAEVMGERRFGDLLLVRSPQQGAIHMCVFIADDVVFTKNGADFLQPWVLMRLSEMLKRYTSDPPAQLITYRRTST